MAITPLQREILEILHKNDGGKFLSFRQIGNMLKGGRHHQSVVNNIKHLINQGYLREDRNEGKYIVLEHPMSDVFEFPVFGFVQCGNQGSAVVSKRPIDYIPYSTKSLGITDVNDYFFVEADGNSMEPFVSNGDLLLIRKWTGWAESDKVMVIHNGRPKLKKVLNMGGKRYLVSLNRDHENLEILPEDDIEPVGVVKKVIKNF